MEHEGIQIINLLNTDRLKKIEENRQILEPIIQAVIVLGRQGIAFRGRHEQGKVTINDDFTGTNEGNFRAILSYRAQGDERLRKHLESERKDKYLSPLIQNEIIEACYMVITRQVVARIRTARFFSILVDETIDISTIEQVTICARYLHPDTQNLHEDFLKFVPTSSTTGHNLALLIMQCLRDLNLDCTYLVGQGYDGAANMSGVFNGVQAIIRENCPHALYLHCASHSLNLAICTASGIPEIRNCLGTIEALYNFFNTPKRKAVIDSVIEKCNYDVAVKTLKRLNLTRWVAKIHAVDDFLELIEVVDRALNEIGEHDSSSNITSLIKSIDFEFIVSALIVRSVYIETLPLSRKLQTTEIDLLQAMNLTISLQSSIDNLRSNENNFKVIFDRAVHLAEAMNIEVTKKRTTRRQTGRSNPETNSLEDYYRISIYNCFLDFYKSELMERFSKHIDILSGFSALFMPVEGNFDEIYQQNFEKIARFYGEYLQNETSSIYAELKSWRKYVAMTQQQLEIKPTVSTINSLKNCPKEVFPNIHILLQILITLPVTTAEPERTFSTLKRIKTFLRNRMAEDRLNGLAALNIHTSIPVKICDVFEVFASSKERKIDLIL